MEIALHFFYPTKILLGLSARCWGSKITLRHTTLGRTQPDEW